LFRAYWLEDRTRSLGYVCGFQTVLAMGSICWFS
jgi:hypothetical protein